MPTHAEKRVLPYTPEELFDLVADIERYPEFLPWCVGTRVTKREDNVIDAEMLVGFKIFRERFVTRDVLDRPRRIDVSYAEGPFQRLNNHWVFTPVGEGACELDFYIDFEFSSKLLQKTIGYLFNEAVQLMVRRFEQRARALYGPRNDARQGGPEGARRRPAG
ncbi:MAG: type II toxin-antitoxin system RatA family toxin [Proteobacteria bacterium]|nr:type II toxin-antitoxin system RatA family toxin [Pseudomonadota bacterium]